MSAVRFLFMFLQLLLRDILKAKLTMAAFLMFDHSLLELAFTAFGKFVGADYFEDMVEITTRKRQAWCLTCYTFSKGLIAWVVITYRTQELFRVQFIAFLAFSFIFTWRIDVKWWKALPVQIVIDETQAQNLLVTGGLRLLFRTHGTDDRGNIIHQGSLVWWRILLFFKIAGLWENLSWLLFWLLNQFIVDFSWLRTQKGITGNVEVSRVSLNVLF